MAKPKNYKRYPGEVRIGRMGDVELVKLPMTSTPQWHNLKLYRHVPPGSGRRTFWLGWNGERLSENVDTKTLEKFGLRPWVEAVAREML